MSHIDQPHILDPDHDDTERESLDEAWRFYDENMVERGAIALNPFVFEGEDSPTKRSMREHCRASARAVLGAVTQGADQPPSQQVGALINRALALAPSAGLYISVTIERTKEGSA